MAGVHLGSFPYFPWLMPEGLLKKYSLHSHVCLPERELQIQGGPNN